MLAPLALLHKHAQMRPLSARSSAGMQSSALSMADLGRGQPFERIRAVLMLT